jgi:hypothetical protein
VQVKPAVEGYISNMGEADQLVATSFWRDMGTDDGTTTTRAALQALYVYVADGPNGEIYRTYTQVIKDKGVNG